MKLLRGNEMKDKFLMTESLYNDTVGNAKLALSSLDSKVELQKYYERVSMLWIMSTDKMLTLELENLRLELNYVIVTFKVSLN